MGVLLRLGDAQLGQAVDREIYSPKVLVRDSGLKATWTLGMVASYWVMQTKYSGKQPFLRSKPVKSGSTRRCG